MSVMSRKEGTHAPPGSDTNYLYITILCVVSTNYREYVISHSIIYVSTSNKSIFKHFM